MFGESVTLRDDYALWWSYVPHFIGSPGYVYAYSFGELLVLALFNLYQKRGAEFVPQYVDVLAAGDSDYPDRILAKIGLDLTDPTFWMKDSKRCASSSIRKKRSPAKSTRRSSTHRKC